MLRQAVRDSSKVQIFEPDDLLHHLATAWPRQVIQGLDFLTCNLGIKTQNLTSVESKWNDLRKNNSWSMVSNGTNVSPSLMAHVPLKMMLRILRTAQTKPF